jgi:hypothetical protein
MAVGDGLGVHSEIAALDGEVLRVRVAPASWLKTFRDFRKDIQSRLARAAGPLAPRAITLSAGELSGSRATARSKRESRLKSPAAPAPDTVTRLNAVADRLKDALPDEQRALFLSAALSYSQRFPESLPRRGESPSAVGRATDRRA